MNTDRPLVSVLVLTYNHEKYVRQALESILMQDVNFEYEILVGDDCSTDGTVEILKEYARNYSSIKLFLNPTNLGATKNACNILKNARGHYLATCEGDDYWTDPEKLKIQVKFLEENPKFVGCTHLFSIVDERGIRAKKILDWVNQKDIFTINDFKGYILPGQPSTYVRRNLVFDNRVNIDYVSKVHSMIGDRTAMLLFLMYGNFGLIRRQMSDYRIRNDNASLTNRLKKKLEGLRVNFEITMQLENLLYENGIKREFVSFKKVLFSKCIGYFLCNHEYKALLLAKEICRSSNENFIIFFMHTLYYLPYKMLERIRY